MDEKSLAIQLAIEQFPEYVETIQQLSQETDDFRDLCVDYAEARQALTYWSAPPEASSHIAKEYRVLVAALEADILEMLKERDQAGY